MNTENLKNKTVRGVAWSAIERFSTLLFQLLINILLARILLPEDFGLIAMLSVFIQFSSAFIDCGFTNALIQRKDRSEKDFCTIFYFNIIVSIFLYSILYVSAPLIAGFYNMPQLESVTKVLCLNLIIGAFSSIHKTKLSINLDFKTQAFISLISAIISGCIAVILAYLGKGVWALVWLSLINVSIQTVLFLFWGTHWIPKFFFSFASFKKLFNYSSKILGATLLSLFYRNLYPVLIGRKYSVVDLGYYNRADLFSSLPSSSIVQILSRVAFPAFSLVQDNSEQLKKAYTKYIVMSSLIVFPIMIGFSAIAKPLIELLLTEKWVPTVVLLQILCLDCMFDHINSINLNILFVKGRSDLALKLEVVKKIIAISTLLVAIPFGLIAICWVRVVYCLLAMYINTYYTKAMIGMTRYEQIKLFTPYLICSLLMWLLVYFIQFCFFLKWQQLFVGFFSGIIFYIVLIYLFRRKVLEETYMLFRSLLISKLEK